jgi:drug/metabolite transporter (DMT)-like permease
MHFRNFVGILGFTALLYSAKNLPIFISQTIFNIAPFWAAIMSYFINKEKITLVTFVAMVGCFAGVVILGLSKQNS